MYDDDDEEDVPLKPLLHGEGYEHTRHLTTLARTKLLQWLDGSADFSWQPREASGWGGYGPVALCTSCRWPDGDAPATIDVGREDHPLRLRVRRGVEQCYQCAKTLIRPSDRPYVIREYLEDSVKTLATTRLDCAQALLGIHFLNWFVHGDSYETKLEEGLGDEQHTLAIDYSIAVLSCPDKKSSI